MTSDLALEVTDDTINIIIIVAQRESGAVLKEKTYETSHLPPLKHRLISACVIGQEPLSVTNQITQDIRACFGVQIQTQERYRSLFTLKAIQVRSYNVAEPISASTTQMLF